MPWYESATLPLALTGTDWTASPYGSDQRRFLGLARIRRRSWRSTTGRASARLLSLNHPRLAKPDVGALLSSMVNDILWGQNLAPVSQGAVSMSVGGGYAATGLRVNLRITTLQTATQFLGVPPAPTGPGGIVRLPRLPSLALPHATEVGASVAPALPDPTGTDLALLLLLWTTGCGPVLPTRCRNDHIYVGFTDNAHADAVLRRFPASVTYA